MITQIYSENLKIYLITLGFEKLINISLWLQFFVSVPMLWFFINHLQLNTIGYSLTKFLSEVVVIAILNIAYNYIEKGKALEQINSVSWKENFKSALSSDNK